MCELRVLDRIVVDEHVLLYAAAELCRAEDMETSLGRRRAHHQLLWIVCALGQRELSR